MLICVQVSTLTVILVLHGTCASHPRVTVKEGELEGSVERLSDGEKYYSFKGIPYAQPPVGDLRFRDPLPPKPWTDVHDAKKHGAVCPQLDLTKAKAIPGNEDCLFLNVYTKSLDPSSKTPVMVFIHGGSFNSGSGDSLVYGPKYLLQHDVIVVTINYRLEVLGFLSLNIPEVPGNAGMKDQVAALKWVQNNIAKFGGDPDNVTIFGESAGSASVTYHMISPMSKGLFQKVIAQSGSCIHDWALGRCAKERAFRIGKVLGKDTENIDELLQYLRSVSASDLIGMTYKTRTDDETHLDIPIFFAPVVEKRFEGVVPFLEEEPIDILVKGHTSAVPLMIGYNSGEGILTASDEIISDKNNDTKYLVPREIARKISENKAREMGERIKQYYIGNQIFSNDTINEYVEMATDTNVMYNMIRYANYHTATKEPVFIYRFDYDTDLNVVKKMLRRGYIKGASHADDLFYLFNSLVTDGVYRKQEKLKEIMYNVTKMWTDFAKTGNPTPDNRLGVTWEPLKTVNEYEFMLLEDPLSVGPIPEYDRLHFWNNLYCEAGAPCIESLK